MNINSENATLFNELFGKVPTAILYEQVFGMTQAEANEAVTMGFQEHLKHDSRVEAVYVAKAMNTARRECGFREKSEEVKPMPPSQLERMMGAREQSIPDEEEL